MPSLHLNSLHNLFSLQHVISTNSLSKYQLNSLMKLRSLNYQMDHPISDDPKNPHFSLSSTIMITILSNGHKASCQV